MDLLLIQIPNVYEAPYFVGVAALVPFLKEAGQKVAFLDPLSNELLKSPALQAHFEKELQTGSAWRDFNQDHVPLSQKMSAELAPMLSSMCQEIFTQIEKQKPRAVGFSLILGNVRASLYFAQEIRSKYPEIKIVCGGPGFHLNPDFLRSPNSVFDCAIQGEGEFELLEFLKGRRPEVGSAPIDLEALPLPDFSILDGNYFFEKEMGASKMYPVSFARGCPYRCSFCAVRKYSYQYRHFSVERSLEVLKRNLDLGKTQFICVDPIINGDPVWFRQFTARLRDENWGVQWRGSLRLQKELLDFDYLEGAFASGCTGVIIGLESGAPTVLRHMKKYHDKEGIDAIFEQLAKLRKKYEFAIDLQLIVGYPTETEENFNETVEFIMTHFEIISRISSFSVFQLEGECLDYVKRIEGEGFITHYDSPLNWSSRVSTPEIRMARMQRLEKIFRKLRIPHRAYFDDLLQNSRKNTSKIDLKGKVW